MTKINSLYEFVDKAIKNRKYPNATGFGLKAALKLFEAEANDEEKASLEKFKNNIGHIYQSISTKNKNITVSSLATYKSRVEKLVRDYEKYGIDPTKMNSWSTQPIIRRKKSSPIVLESDVEQKSDTSVPASSIQGSMHRIELSLRPDVKFLVLVPRDIKKTEADILKGILESLVIKE